MESPRVTRGVAYIGIMNLTDGLIAFAFYFFIARILPTSDIGHISMMFFIMSAFNTFTLLALHSAVIKYVAEFTGAGAPETATAVTKKAFRLLSITSLPAFLVMVILSPWISSTFFGGGLSATVLITVLLSALLLNFMNYCGGIMYGLGLFGDVTVMNIVFYAFSRFPALVLAFLNFGVLGVGFGLIIGISTSLVYSIFRLRGKLARTSADFSTKRLLSFSCPLYVSNMLYLGQGWLDLVLLYALTGNSALIGAYYLVIGGIYVISIFSTPVTFTLLPTMSHRYGENGIAGLEKPVSSAFRIMTIVVVPLSAGLAAVAPTALKVAYGSSYVQNSLAFALLATVAVFSGYWGILSSALQVLEKTLWVLLIAIVGLISNALVISATASLLGTVGAALGRSCMIIVMFLIAFTVLRRNASLNLTFDRKLSAKILTLAIMIGIPLLLVDNTLRSYDARPLVAGTIDLATFLMLGFAGFRILRPLNGDDAALVESAFPRALRGVARSLVEVVAD